MTDNMTDITLKKEKIQDLFAKHIKYLNLLEGSARQTIPIDEVKLWINDLLSPISAELAENGISSVKVNGVSHESDCSDSETDIDSQLQTKTVSVDVDHNINGVTDSPINCDIINDSQRTETYSDISREISDSIDLGQQLINCLDNNSEPTQTESTDNNKTDPEVSVETKDIETGAKDSDIEDKDTNRNNRIDSIGSELSSDNSEDKNTDNSMSGTVRGLRSRNKRDNKVRQSSDSSEVDFDDSSDTPYSGTESESDFEVNGKSQTGPKSQRKSKYDRLLGDFRLKRESVVQLINLNEDITEIAFEDCLSASQTITKLEKQLFESLRSKGFVCRKMKEIKPKEPKIKKDNKEDDSDSDKEIKRLCRLPKMNRNDRNGSKREKNSNNNIDSNNSESSGSDKKPKKKKMKTSTPIKNNNDSEEDLESDCEVSKVKSSHLNSIIDKKEVKIDALDSEVSSEEEEEEVVKTKVNKTSPKKNTVKSESDADNESDGNDEDEKKDVKKGSSKSRRSAKKEEKDDQTVIDLDSDEDIVPKKKVSKRRVSEDDDYTNDNHSSDNSSVIESSEGMDPSAQDSDSFSESNSNSKSNNKKKSKSKSKDKKGKRKRVRIVDSSDDDCKVLSDENDSPNKSRKNIRKIISDKKIKQQTKDAAEAERDRTKRIRERQKEYNDLIKTRSLKSADVTELILEFDKETKEPLVEVDKTLVKFLKPHQKNGIEFMYNCMVESIEQLNESEGSGCILAHSMGLGKTLQVITFLYTVLTHKDIKKHLKRALVICPVNTIKNWANEFRVWLVDNDLDDLLVFEMFDAKTPAQRAELLNIWHKRGGVMIIGLTLFSSLVMGGRGKKPPKSVRDAISKCLLDPGPELVICDEGHLLKNEKTAYNKAVSQIKSVRRAVLTGTPLQNNLNEYHVMVHFVKPNLLGNRKEFTNRFVNPITNGQHEDSTDYDVKIMKKRVHILHTLLNGCVHRCDYNVLVPYLQPKHEYVISVMLTEKQIELYSHYLKNISDRQKISLLADYGSLRLIWNHPILLFEQHRRRIEKANDDSLDEFIDDDEDAETPPSDSDVELLDDAGPSKPLPKRRMRTRYGNTEEEEEVVEELDKKSEDSNDALSNAWFAPLIKKDEAKHIELSGKFILLFAILEECEKLGDKILLFSQSLDTLDLVEEMLKLRMERAAEEARKAAQDNPESAMNDATNVWFKNRDYFRLDGSTASDYRKAWIDVFNDEDNYRARLFLISTKAGGLGINLVGANRCIIFDASWNPTHDVQAIFRIFRFGQKKPVYVYRFVAQGTMEEKIYERQIIKQSLSCRVVDEQAIQRHFKAGELSELYNFKPDQRKDRPIHKLPKDRLLAELLKNHKDYIVDYHEHDSLLENKPEEDMTEEEKQAAWTEYEQEKDGLFSRETQEREAQMQRQFFLAQAQQQAQQQQQQQYQQYAQQIYQQLQAQQAQQAQSGNQFPQNADYQSMLTNTIYQNIMRQQAELRKQQQQRYQEARQQRLAELAQMSGQSTSINSLPSYDRMTVEDIGKYLKSLNNDITPNQLIQRIFGIIETGLNTCSKELNSAKQALIAQNTPELRSKYEKLAKEVFNLNRQKTRAQAMFRSSTTTRSGPNILRQHLSADNNSNVEEIDNEMEASTSAAKTTDQLIEEVD